MWPEQTDGSETSWQGGPHTLSRCLHLVGSILGWIAHRRPQKKDKDTQACSSLSVCPTGMLPAILLFLHWLRRRVPKDLENSARALDI